MATPTPRAESVALAQFKTVKTGEPIEVTVHFNPASLQYTVSNTLKDEGSGSKKKQYVSQTTAKLTMDLVFDTTATGQDVRETTDKMAKLLKPHGPSGKQVPPLVEFGWGLYRFTGMVEQYKETLDYFGASGVPLRASVNLTLSSQDVVFESGKNPNASVDGDLRAEPVTVPTAAGPGAPPSSGPAGVASALGDPRAARAIASANGSASLRFSAGAELAVGVGAGVSLGAAAAFSAGASAGFGMSGAAGIGISGGAGIGISGGAGIGVSGGASAGFGAGASASLGASAGASAPAGADFSGLRGGASASASMPSPSAALSLTAGSSGGSGVQFGLGGRAQSSGSASLSADVGANAELTARLGFGE
jgi:hypothetical protein